MRQISAENNQRDLEENFDIDEFVNERFDQNAQIGYGQFIEVNNHLKML